MYQLLYLGPDSGHIVNAHQLTPNTFEGKRGGPLDPSDPTPADPDHTPGPAVTTSGRLIKFQLAADCPRPYAFVSADEARELLADASGLYQLPAGVVLPEVEAAPPPAAAKKSAAPKE